MNKKEIEKNYLKKIDEIKKYNKAYFEKDDPLVSDKYYDDIKQEILQLEKKHKFLKNKDSPSKKIGYKPSGKFIYNEQDLLSMEQKMKHFM